MKDKSFEDPNNAAVSSRDGSRSLFIFPPLAVLCVGMLMVFLFLGPVGITASAEDLSNGGTSASLISLRQTSEIAQNQDPAPYLQESEQMTLTSQQTGFSEEETSHIAKSDFVPPTSSISAVFTPEVQYWATSIVQWANNAGIDPNLAATVIQIESCGDPHALSLAGAIGLFQVMPFHFSETDDPYDPDTNALRGLAYLKRSLDKSNGDIRLALAGYNGGIGVIDRSESTWAGETIRYTYWGSGIYKDATGGDSKGLHLQEWINANGLYLCMHAAERLGINP
jgi:hypothetical protein